MKSLIQAIVVATAFVAPVAFGQSNQPVSRAQVLDQLVQLRNAGYSAHGRDPSYPADVQAAETRVSARNGAARAENNAFGGVGSGLSQSGESAANPPTKSLYARH